MLLSLLEHLGTTEVRAMWREVHLRLQVLGCAAFCLLVFKYLLDELILILSISVCFAEYSAIHLLFFFSSSPFCFNTPGRPLYSKAFCRFSSKFLLVLPLVFLFQRRNVKQWKIMFYSKGRKTLCCIFFHLCTPVFCLYIVSELILKLAGRQRKF